MGRERVVAAVLGDLGRSPRTLNHAWAAAESGYAATLVGYAESPLDQAAEQHTKLEVRAVREAGRAPDGAPRAYVLLYSVWKGVVLAVRLFRALRGARADLYVVQNPPSLPTLPAAWAAARLGGAKWVVDWHNFGYAMLAMRLGEGSGFVGLVRRAEYFFARRADAHLCVSEAMAARLLSEGDIDAAVLYDLPRERPRAIQVSERADCRRRLAEAQDGLLAICPTSWTADEDVDLLLDALKLRESGGSATPIEVVITGKGPRKAEGQARIAGLELAKSRVRTAFLSPEDYRGLLRAADVGVSLHRSASGVDLPMKIVDMFSERTPAAAFDYGPALREQVENGVTGWSFRTAAELAALLDRLAEAPEEITGARVAIEARWSECWTEAWRARLGPVLGDAS